MLLSGSTHHSAVYQCFPLLDIFDLGMFCFGGNGGQCVYLCVQLRYRHRSTVYCNTGDREWFMKVQEGSYHVPCKPRS